MARLSVYPNDLEPEWSRNRKPDYALGQRVFCPLGVKGRCSRAGNDRVILSARGGGGGVKDRNLSAGAAVCCLRPPSVTVSLDYGEPGPQGLDLSMKLACVDRQFNALVLDFRELGTQLGVLGRQSEQEQGVGNGGPPTGRSGRGRRR
jgi:hypothetical protein